MIWPPGQSDIRGNGIVDKLAEEAAHEAETLNENTQNVFCWLDILFVMLRNFPTNFIQDEMVQNRLFVPCCILLIAILVSERKQCHNKCGFFF